MKIPFLLTTKGRLTRLAYSQVATGAALYLGTVSYLQLRFWETLPKSPTLFWGFYIVLFAPAAWIFFCATAKRLQDFTINGWFALIIAGIALVDWQVTLGLCVVIALIASTKYNTIYGAYDMVENAKLIR
ncbi:MAG TPA: hypothetical protein DCW60_04470 [Sutterella sp.]|nr:hypothetical protein [Sutterella sp.]